MASYKIRAIDTKPPREWANPRGGTVYYISVAFEGHTRPVEVGKKSPDALHVGDVLEGDIIPKPDYSADGFKAAPPAFGGGGGYSRPAPNQPARPAYQPKDEHAIAKAVALKAAVDYRNTTDRNSAEDVLKTANAFLKWLESDGLPTATHSTTQSDPVQTYQDMAGDEPLPDFPEGF